MRGDSLRDLYAKTLAVVGLGLLAGAGAIVDYWPVGGALPPVGAVAELRYPVPALSRNIPANVPAPVIRTASYRAVAAEPEPVYSESFRRHDFVEVTTPVVADEPDVLPEPDIDEIPVDLTLPAALLNATPIDLSAWEPAVEADAGAGSDDARRFLMGAIRKTRESLRDARGFLGDKIQGVVWRFKKVSPFFDVTGVPLK